MIEALRQATLFEKVKPFIFEPMEGLTQSEKQLLCLAKCLMTHPKILIIENVHPHTQYIMDICVKKYFRDAAVIIIGGSEKQFTVCDRMSELV
jgi:ABC-type phosphate transport system ATPase subunit